MGLYSHLTDADLIAKRDQYMAAHERSLTGPSKVASSGSSVSFNDRAVEYQQTIKNLENALRAINAELQARGLAPNTSTAKPRQPIYLIGR